MKRVQQFLGIGIFSIFMIISGTAQNNFGSNNLPVSRTFPKIGVVEAASNFATIEGIVYVDKDKNCRYQSNEQNLKRVTVQAISLATGEIYTAQTDEHGYYTIPVQPDRYSIIAEVPSPYYKLSCQQESIVEIANVTETKFIDLGMKATVTCAFLNIEIDADIIHKTDASIYTVAYCNHGTVAANDAYVQLILDDYLDIESSTQPIGTKDGNTFIFELGTIESGVCNDFELTIKVKENAILGQTHCTNVSIYPDNICDPAIKGIREQTTATNTNTNTNQESAHVLGEGRDYVFEDHVILRSEDRATLMMTGALLSNFGDSTRSTGISQNTNNNVTQSTANNNSAINIAALDPNSSTTSSGNSNSSGWTTEQINKFYVNLAQNFPINERFSAENCQANTPFYHNIEINNNNNNSSSGENTTTNDVDGGSSNSTTTTTTTTTTTISIEDSNEDSAIKKIFEQEDSEEIAVQVDVLPNPFLEKATITIKGGSYKQLTLRLMNVAGQELRQLLITNNQVQLYREDLARGMYIYRIEGDGAIIHSGKLMIR